MKYLRISYGELLQLPADYVTFIIQEAQRETEEAKLRR